MFEKFKFHILLHLIVFMWGFTGILGKLIDLEPLYIVWWRVLIAFVGLAIAMKVMKKSLQIPSGKRLLQIIGVGIIRSPTFVESSLIYDEQISSLLGR